MEILGFVFVFSGCMGLLWFGVPAVFAGAEWVASRTTGRPMEPERVATLKELLYKVAGSIVFASAGASLLAVV